jgi:hypothetical protein
MVRGHPGIINKTLNPDHRSGEMWKFHRSMTRPFFSHDRISHFNIFDRYAEDVINQMKSRLRAGHPVDFQVSYIEHPYSYSSHLDTKRLPQDAISRFTLDSATEFLFGSCVHSLSAGLPYPHNVTTVEAPTGGAEIANDFARAFSQAQVIVSQRVRRSWLWPLFEPFADKTEEPMKTVNAYIEPILKDAIEKRKVAAMRGEKLSDELSDDTLLDHLVQQTTGARLSW